VKAEARNTPADAIVGTGRVGRGCGKGGESCWRWGQCHALWRTPRVSMMEMSLSSRVFWWLGGQFSTCGSAKLPIFAT
jgi:hypothetical protein